MKKKSLGITIIGISIVVLSNIFGLFGPVGDVITGISVSVLAMILKKFSDSGEWLSGMSSTFWAINIISIVVVVLGTLFDSSSILGLSEAATSGITKITMVLNALVLGLGTTTKMHPGDSTIISYKKGPSA